jgi:hypothetical protein
MSGVCGGGKLLAADGAASDGFGESVSVNRDTLFVGAMGSAQDGVECGSAYVYTRTGSSFTQQQKLNPSDCATDDWFGLSVSVSDDTAVVGAPHGQNDHGPGSAYIFTRTGSSWTQQQKLLAGDDMPWNAFGISVSVSGDTTVVGAHWDSDNGIGAGSAYVFTRTGSTWTQQQKLLPDDGAANDKFGISVSLSGDTAVIGVYNYDTDRGAAYVFTRTGSSFIQQQKLVPDDGPGDDFGLSVSVSGATAVIGARLDDDNGTNSGAAYVFTRTGSNFTQQQKLVPDDAAAGKGFGHQVSLSGDTVVVASGGTDDNGTNTGSAYVFTRTGSNFTQRQKLLPGDGAAGDYFGYSLSVSGRTAVVSSYGDDDNGSHAGSVYVFALPAP